MSASSPPATPRTFDPRATSNAIALPVVAPGRYMLMHGAACPRTPGLKCVPGSARLTLIGIGCASAAIGNAAAVRNRWLSRKCIAPCLDNAVRSYKQANVWLAFEFRRGYLL